MVALSSPASLEGPWDAVVVGSGASGGVAAHVLSRAGLKVLVLEAGPNLSTQQVYTAEPRNTIRRLVHLSSGRQQRQANHPGYWKQNPDLFVDERDNPYSTPAQHPFLWTRGRQVGGKSLTWGGITLRLSDYEFKAAERDGFGPCWPISGADLNPYYDRLERFLGVHGHADGLPQLPDGCFLDPLPFTRAERALRDTLAEALDLPLIHSRGFALPRSGSGAGAWPASSSQGRALGAALASGRVQLRADAVVSHLELDATGSRAEAVVFIDRHRRSRHRIEAPLVVLCASTIESVRLLLHSSERWRSGGLVDPSGTLGHYQMDHISSARFFSLPASGGEASPQELSGAGSVFIPNTVNLGDDATLPFRRGYGLWGAIERFEPPGFLKRRPDSVTGFLIGHGEVLPRSRNRITLDGSRPDAWGLPTPRIDCRWGGNEQRLVVHMQERMESVVAAAGGTIAPLRDLVVMPLVEPILRRSPALAAEAAPPGYYIHELGGARMAADESEGVLNAWNQCWRLPNLLVTDGSCWPTSGWQSPTLTHMALTWRACEAAAARQRRGNLALQADG
ncbi:MAG: GMC oxidoreductase [Cyanobacteriota bacterium]